MSNKSNMIKISGVVSKEYFRELVDGRASFNDVEWDITYDLLTTKTLVKQVTTEWVEE